MGGGVRFRPRARTERSRRSGRRAIDVLTHPDLARLHPTFGHPESEQRLAVLLEAFPDAREGKPAVRAALERVHAHEYLKALESLTEPTWFDYPNTIASQTSWEAWRVIGRTSALWRASGMNDSGRRSPRSGWFQRTSASTRFVSPVARSISG